MGKKDFLRYSCLRVLCMVPQEGLVLTADKQKFEFRLVETADT